VKTSSYTILIGTRILPILLAGFFAFVVIFVCVRPLDWPYYEPIAQGATTTDPAACSIFPRVNLSPIATIVLTSGVSLQTRMGCYPRNSDGIQPCIFQIQLFNPDNAEISYTAQPVTIRGPDDEELINLSFHSEVEERLGEHPALEVRGTRVTIKYSERVSLLLRRVALPERITATIPAVIINSKTVHIPKVDFTRRENLTCVGLFANY